MPEVNHSILIVLVLGLTILFWIWKTSLVHGTSQLCDYTSEDVYRTKIRNLTRQIDENNQKWKENEEALKSRLYEVRRQLLDVKRTHFKSQKLASRFDE